MRNCVSDCGKLSAAETPDDKQPCDAGSTAGWTEDFFHSRLWESLSLSFVRKHGAFL